MSTNDNTSPKRSSGVVSPVVMSFLDRARSGNEPFPRFVSGLPGTEPPLTSDELVVDDIDFDATKDRQTLVTHQVDERVHRARRRERETNVADDQRDRQERSFGQVRLVREEARTLTRAVDVFLRKVHEAATRSADNPYLCRRLETLRRTCAGFVSVLGRQLPGPATSLFAQAPEEMTRE